MRVKKWSLIGFVLFAAGTLEIKAPQKAKALAVQSDKEPKILSARVKGKKLILIGENFAAGAMILINDEPQGTTNDSANPSTRLIGKRAGNAIPDNTYVIIQVQSANKLTDKFPLFKGRVVTLDDDVGKPIRLKVGERFLLSLGNAGYQYVPAVLDPSILKKVPDVDIPGSQGIFEALRPGSTKLSVVGELPCHKTIPPCLAPTLLIEFSVIVE